MSAPWAQRGWVGARLKELLYDGVSWPYMVSIALTLKFLLSPPDATTRDAMLASWALAMGRRLGAKWIDGKLTLNGNGNPNPPAPPGPSNG